jgi:hypothetical protein
MRQSVGCRFSAGAGTWFMSYTVTQRLGERLLAFTYNMPAITFSDLCDTVYGHDYDLNPETVNASMLVLR